MKHLTFSEFQMSNKNKKIMKTNLRKFHIEIQNFYENEKYF